MIRSAHSNVLGKRDIPGPPSDQGRRFHFTFVISHFALCTSIVGRSRSSETGPSCSSRPLAASWITPGPARQAGPTRTAHDQCRRFHFTFCTLHLPLCILHFPLCTSIVGRSGSSETGPGCSSRPLAASWITPGPARQAGPTRSTLRRKPPFSFHILHFAFPTLHFVLCIYHLPFTTYHLPPRPSSG